jgi:CheY-like chemotaxis protein
VTPAHLAAAFLAALAPVQVLASSGAGGPWGETEALALLGVAAAFALHHVSRRRPGVALRWQHMLDERLPHLRLGERLHALHLRSALLKALHQRPSAAAAGHVRRVLVVDDDADVRTAIGEALASQGFAVSEAADGVEGLRRAREERPDVILLDLMMPRMDGFEFRAAQRSDERIAAIPVVVVSASDGAPRSFGAAAVLHKPFDLGALFEAVDRHAVAAAA